MRSYTHIAGAILLFITFAYLTNLNNILIGIFCAGWISVFPDIIDRLLGEHRGYGHSFIWLIPFTLIGSFDLGVEAALVIGFISHIFFDLFAGADHRLQPESFGDAECHGGDRHQRKDREISQRRRPQAAFVFLEPMHRHYDYAQYAQQRIISLRQVVTAVFPNILQQKLAIFLHKIKPPAFTGNTLLPE